MKTYQQLDKAQAWEKVRHYCSYQERCHTEVREKLHELGMNSIEADELVSRLIEENYLNEERFARMYAGGHFRIKKWGRVKIANALKQKGVSAWSIKNALAEIEPGPYFDLLSKLAVQKWNTIKTGNLSLRRHKCKQYLLQRGFENGLIDEVLGELQTKED